MTFDVIQLLEDFSNSCTALERFCLRYLKPRPHQQQCRSNVRLCCQKWQQCQTSFSFISTKSKQIEHVQFVSTLSKHEISFDIVAKNGNNVEAKFDFVERIVRLVAYENVASTLLLVWIGLKFLVSGQCEWHGCFSQGLDMLAVLRIVTKLYTV